jgi:hypothetical protein
VPVNVQSSRGNGVFFETLAGQANSNFRDAAAEPETIADDGMPGIAGPQRIPQVRYTYEGFWGTTWSVSAEQPETALLTPAGKTATDSTNQVVSTISGLVPASNNTSGAAGCVANGMLVTTGSAATSGCTLTFNPTKSSAPDLTFASYWAQPWGHVDARAVVRPTLTVNDGRVREPEIRRLWRRPVGQRQTWLV